MRLHNNNYYKQKSYKIGGFRNYTCGQKMFFKLHCFKEFLCCMSNSITDDDDLEHALEIIDRVSVTEIAWNKQIKPDVNQGLFADRKRLFLFQSDL